MREWWSRIRIAFGGRRELADELQEELHSHLELEIQENLSRGMSLEEARMVARRRFGNVMLIREDAQNAWTLGRFEILLKDLVYAGRMLVRNPGFTAVTIVTLALGIGANTAIFSIADALLFRTLPVPEPERLFQLLQPDGPGLREYGELFAASDFRDMRDSIRPFAQLGGQTEVRQIPVALDGAAEEPVYRSIVSENFFGTLGIRAAIGQTIADAGEGGQGGRREAVISHAFWTRRFGTDGRVLGRTIRIGSNAFEIVGIAQPGFGGIDVGTVTDLWTTLSGERQQQGLQLRLIGRLNPDASIEQATGPLQTLYQHRMSDMAEHAPPNTPKALLDHILGLRLRAVSADRGLSNLRAAYRNPVLIVLGLVGLVLLAACSTVAALFEARRSARSRELAVRVSLGASRWRLVRQLLCEALLIGGAAAVLGIVLANWTAPLIVSLLAPSGMPVQLSTEINGRVLLFTALVSLTTLLMFGLFPAWRSSSGAIANPLKDGNGRISSNRWTTARALIAAQAAMSLVLVIGATIFVRTFQNLTRVDAGMERNVILANVRFRGPERGERLSLAWTQLRERVSEMPGITSVSLSSGSAFNGAFGNAMLRLQNSRAGEQKGGVLFRASTGFFQTSGIPLLQGRDFEPRDFEPTSMPVAILGESAARQFFPDASPIGRAFSNFEDNPPRWVTVIGVVGDTRFQNLRNQPPLAVFLPYTWPQSAPVMTIAMRARTDSAKLGAGLRDAVRGANPNFEVLQVTSQGELIDRTLLRERQMAMIAGFFGALSLLMTAIGLFGTVSYTVAQRTREFGIRMALGAPPGGIAGIVFRESGVAVGIGTAVGLVIGQGMSRLVASMLFGVNTYDASTLAVSISVILAATLGAAALPALRASRTDPMVALRDQ